MRTSDIRCAAISAEILRARDPCPLPLRCHARPRRRRSCSGGCLLCANACRALPGRRRDHLDGYAKREHDRLGHAGRWPRLNTDATPCCGIAATRSITASSASGPNCTRHSRTIAASPAAHARRLTVPTLLARRHVAHIEQIAVDHHAGAGNTRINAVDHHAIGVHIRASGPHGPSIDRASVQALRNPPTLATVCTPARSTSPLRRALVRRPLMRVSQLALVCSRLAEFLASSVRTAPSRSWQNNTDAASAADHRQGVACEGHCARIRRISVRADGCCCNAACSAGRTTSTTPVLMVAVALLVEDEFRVGTIVAFPRQAWPRR